MLLYQQSTDGRTCSVDWTVVAGLAAVSSNHELALEPVLGAPLDGEGGRYAISDSDSGELDGDGVWDRAVGPFQFIPATWEVVGIDGDNDGIRDPQNLADASASAAEALCGAGYAQSARAAVTAYLGSPVRVERVFSESQRIGAYWRELHPVPVTVVPVGAAASTPSGPVELANVGGITIAAHLADSLQSMLDAASADGLILRGWGWRSHEQQIALRAAHCADVWTTPASDCNPPTAIPGQSRHESGAAIDFYVETSGGPRVLHSGDDEFQWLANNGSAYGWYNLPSEPWHWSVDGR